MSVKKDMNKIKALVGEVKEKELKNVDCFASNNLGVFMPISGQCYYAATPFHTHPSYMFIIPFNDQMTLILEEKKIDLKEWKLYALSPGIEHHEKIENEIPRYMAIFISEEMLENCISKYDVSGNLIFNGKEVNLQNRFIERIKYFILEYENGLPGNREVTEALEIDICHQIIRSLLDLSYNNKKITNRFEVNKAINFMRSNFSSNLTVEEIAEEADMSVSHFSKLFKKETDMTVMNYLSKIRIEVAKKLLLNEDISVTEIAHRCGFNSLSYMSSCFSKHTNMSPSEYRNNLNQ